jgi:HK97 family phage prohead protease
MTTKRASLDEILERRRFSADGNGNLFKAVVLEEKAKGYDKETRSQRFVMSSESTDLYGDIVRQTGLKTDNFLKNPVGLAFHDHRKPIGFWKDITKVGGKSKRTEGTLSLHGEGVSDDADQIARMLEANAIRACSIGFAPVDAEWIIDENGRNTYGLDFKESILLECSVCAIPANPDALAKAAGGDLRLAAEVLERVLDTYCETKLGGLYVKREFADAYRQLKGEKTFSIDARGAQAGVGEEIVSKLKAMEAAVTAVQKVNEQRDALFEKIFAEKDGIDGIGLESADLTPEQEKDVMDALEMELKLDTTEAEQKVDSIIERFRKGVASIFGSVEEKASEVVEREEPATEAEEIQEPETPALVKGSLVKAKAEAAKLRARLQATGHLK